VHRDVVGLHDGGVEVFAKRHAEAFRAVFAQIGIIGHDAHAEGLRALGELRADAAHAEHDERFAIHFGALEAFAVPLAADDGGVGLRGLAGEAIIKVKACSAVEMVLPPGVFITTTPRLLATGTSMLSTPTPARPMTFRFGAASSTLAVTLAPLRTMMAWASREASIMACPRPSGSCSP
jgi:hypothetical protein